MDQKDIWEIITVILDGSASDEDKKLFSAWIAESESNKRLFETLSSAHVKKREYSADTREKVYNSLERNILKTQFSRQIKIWQFSVAASLAVIAVLTFFLLTTPKNKEKTVGMVEVTCPYGSTSKVILPDSTRVYLNAGSSIVYPDKFEQSRNIELAGEAFFEVRKDQERPFIVHTGSVNVRVFGTSFNVRNYPEDSNIETTLSEGSVALYGESDLKFQQGIKIVPNEQIIFNKHTGKIEKRSVDAELSSIWMEGKFYFEKQDLKSIVKKLERNYNVQIRIRSEKLEGLVFTGLIDKRLNIFQTLDIMKRYNHFKYTFTKDSICIVDE